MCVHALDMFGFACQQIVERSVYSAPVSSNPLSPADLLPGVLVRASDASGVAWYTLTRCACP